MRTRAIVACEESQAVTIELRKVGVEAYSCDIIDCSGGHPEWHIKSDALALINGNCSFMTCDGVFHRIDGTWDLLIAHPPCTFLTNAGARHLWKGHQLNQERYEKGLEAKAFFMAFLNADCPRIIVENPIPSKIFDLPPYTQKIQPHDFYGEEHPYTKATCLWLKGVSPLVPVEPVEPIATYCPSGSYSKKHGDKHRGLFTKDRARQRSKTFSGVARAIAEQSARPINNKEE